MLKTGDTLSGTVKAIPSRARSSVVGISSFFRVILVLLGVGALFSTQDTTVAAYIVVGYACLAVISALHDAKQNVAFILFLLTFSFFLLNALWVGSSETGGGGISRLPLDAQQHVIGVLLLSLVSIDVAFHFWGRKPRRNIDAPPTPIFSGMGSVALPVFYIAALIFAVGQSAKILHVSTNGYLALYVNYRPPIPYLFGLAEIATGISLAVFLAARPSKERAVPALLAYLAVSSLALAYGQRNPPLIALLLVVFYLTVRERESDTPGRWLPKRLVVTALVALPFILSALYIFSFDRLDRQIESTSLFSGALGLLEQQAGSLVVISNGYVHQAELDALGPYLFAPLLRILPSALVNGDLGAAAGTLSSAPQGSFAQALTFIVNPITYYAGGGLGSSFVAELFQDYGYLGVLLGSVLFGIFLAYTKDLKGSTIGFATLLVILPSIWYAPRDLFFNFGYALLNPGAIGTLLLLWLLGQYAARQQQSRDITLARTKRITTG